MDACKRFRASPKLTLDEANAAAKPLSSGDKSADKQRVADMAQRIAGLQDIFFARRDRRLLLLLQGMDTSGKDGTIRKVFGATDPLGIRTVAFKAPTSTERERDYLWRIHKEVPRDGEIVIFNRSQYEDVLVPSVHGWIDAAECKRRIVQIRDFERMLAETGTVLVKCFLHISKDEQKERLQQRLDNPDKHWKFDPQDIKERKHWDAYSEFYRTAISQTDADHAPWYVIPANSKTHRNLAVTSVLLETMERMQLAYPPARADYANLTIE